MALLPLELVKRHLRVDHYDDDAEISAYQAAAEAIVTEYVGRVIVAPECPIPGPDEADYDPTAIVLPPAVTAAILLVVGDLYEARDTSASNDGDAVLPRPVRALLAPWRIWRTYEETV